MMIKNREWGGGRVLIANRNMFRVSVPIYRAKRTQREKRRGEGGKIFVKVETG
jgi:hypothetical protein